MKKIKLSEEQLNFIAARGSKALTCLDKFLRELKKDWKFCKKCGEYMYKPNGEKRYVCSNTMCPQKIREGRD